MNAAGFVEQWAQWMLHSGWQAAIVAIAAMVVLSLVGRRLSSQLRFSVLFVALLKFAMPPFLIGSGVLLESTSVFSSGDWLSVPSFRNEIRQGGSVNAGSLHTLSNHNVIDPSGGTSMIATSVASESASTSHLQATDAEVTISHRLMPRWLLLLAIVYVCGFVASVLAVARQVARIRHVVRSACFADRGTQERAVILCKQQKMKLPRVLISDNMNSPFATGVLRPVVVLPRAMMDDLEPDQLDIVLAHELVHIRRCDLLTGWLEVILTAVWWFHPVIWWLRSSLRRSREECCDDALVASSLARPVRYCETLIQVARYQGSSIMEPVALGFARSEHPAANRIRRLMDSKLLRRDRLRVSAVVVTLLLGLVLLPGMAPDERPVSKTNLEGWFGWKNQRLKISAEEEARVTELREIAESFFQTRNNVRKFDEPDTRDHLEAILKEQPGFFYTQHLLGTWHLRNDDKEEGQRLLDESLDKAPVVLKQRFRYANDKPLPNTEIQWTTLECNRVQDGSLNSNLELMYPALVTDKDGQIRVPAYKTVCRIRGYSCPVGSVEETETLGWFESKAHTGVLPDMFVWVPYSRPRDFTRTAPETKLLKDAAGTRTQEINSGGNTYVLESVSRASRDANLVSENGRGTAVASTLRTLPDVKNAAWMDHAVIDLNVPDADQFEIQRAMILDSRTKIPLQQFQSGAGVCVFDNRRFHVYSLWNTLPESIDLVLQVYNYDDGFRLIVPAREGAAVQHNGTTLTIPHLIAGQHEGWSSTSGYVGEPRDVNTTCEVELKFTGNAHQKFSVWVALKNGDRWNMKRSGWFSSDFTTVGSERLSVPLADIDHFELRPYAEPTTIFFEDIRLPPRQGELDEDVPVVEFPVNQLQQEFTSDVFSPLDIHFRSRRGNVYAGIVGTEFSVSLQEQDEKQQNPDTNCTIVWSTDGSLVCNSLAEFVVRLDAKIDPQKNGGGTNFWSSSDRKSVTVESKGVPLEAVQTVRLHLSPK